MTQHWQKNIRNNNSRQNFSDIYEAKFGNENYLKIKEIRNWLVSQEQKSDLRAYLLAEDPYSVDK
ncbi:hypothetical protein [uncultured Paraglaciecola sp.]|uniref:hypothetical protein n=1 Tax=uncultured Paraglaciecola sp. TaxID=1765024 RepID=UPI0025954ADC|nr:hypothetical protein [uncultured Paraglaciecola sp.]